MLNKRKQTKACDCRIRMTESDSPQNYPVTKHLHRLTVSLHHLKIYKKFDIIIIETKEKGGVNVKNNHPSTPAEIEAQIRGEYEKLGQQILHDLLPIVDLFRKREQLEGIIADIDVYGADEVFGDYIPDDIAVTSAQIAAAAAYGNYEF